MNVHARAATGAAPSNPISRRRRACIRRSPPGGGLRPGPEVSQWLTRRRSGQDGLERRDAELVLLHGGEGVGDELVVDVDRGERRVVRLAARRVRFVAHEVYVLVVEHSIV